MFMSRIQIFKQRLPQGGQTAMVMAERVGVD
jgi:hypothetical protein